MSLALVCQYCMQGELVPRVRSQPEFLIRYTDLYLSLCLCMLFCLSVCLSLYLYLSLSLPLSLCTHLEYFVPDVGAEYVDHAPAVRREVFVRPLIERDYLQSHHGIIGFAELID